MTTYIETTTDLVRTLTPFFVLRTEFPGMDRALFYAYDAAGDIDVSAGWTDITLDTEVEESTDFTHAADSAEVTINTTGTYEVTYYITTYVSVGTSQSESRAKMQVDTGGGYADIPGTLATMLNRDTSQGETNASVTFIKDFSAADKIKLIAQRESGTNTILTLANGCGVVIRDATASGSRGPAGAGSVADAEYVCMSLNAELTDERVLTAGDSISVTDAGAGLAVTVALTTPGTLTVATANSATSPHLHTITSSSNPGAAVSLLASDASGYLQLVGLGIGAAPGSADLHFATGTGITHVDGIAAGQFLRANGTRYVPDTLDVADITDLAYAVPNLTLGLANAAGAANTVIRSDATILAFDATVPDTIQCDDAAAAGAATVAARRDHTHGIVCAAPGANLSVSTTNAEGSATSFARSDHAHAITSSSNPGAAASLLATDASGYLQLVGLGIGAAPGSADLHFGTGIGITHADGVVAGQFLRANGTRYIPDTLDVADITDLAYAVPNLTLGLANAAGAANTVIRSDATILAFDATVPDIIQCDDAAAAGAAAVAARRDHTHGIVCAAPGANLTVSTTNAEGSATSFARSDHSHAITSSSNPGAAASLLATDASGYLQLVGLGIGAAPFAANVIAMADGAKIGCDAVSPVIVFDDTNDELELTVTGGGWILEGDATSPNLRGGFSGNTVTATVVGATISGGGLAANINTVTDNYGTIGGGEDNQAGNNIAPVDSSTHATVGGGQTNLASAGFSTIAGGAGNTVSGGSGAICGGSTNTITVAGGSSFIGGGYGHTASATRCTIGGGYQHTASGGHSGVFAGYANTASGQYSVIPGGSSNDTAGDYTFAGGFRATIAAAHDGAFLWAGQTNAVFNSLAADEFAVRSRGGFRHAYDDSNYWTAQVTAAGAVTFDAVGASAGFAFSDLVTVNASLTVPAGQGITMGDGATVGQVAGPLITFDDTLNYLNVTGGNVQVTGSMIVGVAGALETAGASFQTNTSGTNTPLVIVRTDSAANNRVWDIIPAATTLTYRAVGDAFASATNYMVVTRSGVSITNIVFPNGNVGIGAAGPAGTLHVDNVGTTAQPVLYLDQGDVSEEMIEFATTIGVGNAIEAIGAKTLTTTHFIKIVIPGALTRYIPCGTIA